MADTNTRSNCSVEPLNHTPSEMLEDKSPTEIAHYLPGEDLLAIPTFDRDEEGKLKMIQTFDIEQARGELSELRKIFEDIHIYTLE